MTVVCAIHNATATGFSDSRNPLGYRDDVKTFGDRLIEARKAAGYENPKAAQEAFGFSSVYYEHEKKEHAPRRDSVERYASAYRVDYNWLLTGVGAMKGDGEVISDLRIDPEKLAPTLWLLAIRGKTAHDADPNLPDFSEWSPEDIPAVWVQLAEFLSTAIDAARQGRSESYTMSLLRGVATSWATEPGTQPKL